MLARCPGLFIQASMTAAGCLLVPGDVLAVRRPGVADPVEPVADVAAVAAVVRHGLVAAWSLLCAWGRPHQLSSTPSALQPALARSC